MTDSLTAHDETTALNGLHFHYREWGDRAAPPLALLHGFTGNARHWDTFAQTVAARYRVLALDQRGHGEDRLVRVGCVEDAQAHEQVAVSDAQAGGGCGHNGSQIELRWTDQDVLAFAAVDG